MYTLDCKCSYQEYSSLTLRVLFCDWSQFDLDSWSSWFMFYQVWRTPTRTKSTRLDAYESCITNATFFSKWKKRLFPFSRSENVLFTICSSEKNQKKEYLKRLYTKMLTSQESALHKRAHIVPFLFKKWVHVDKLPFRRYQKMLNTQKPVTTLWARFYRSCHIPNSSIFLLGCRLRLYERKPGAVGNLY